MNTWPTQPIPVGPNVIDDPKMPGGQGRLCADPTYWAGKIAPDGKPFKVGCIFDPYDTTQFVVPFEEMDWPASSYSPLTRGFITCGVTNRAFAKERVPAACRSTAPKAGSAPAFSRCPTSPRTTWATSHRSTWCRTSSTGTRSGRPCYSGSLNTATGITFIGHIGPGNGQSGQGYLEAVNTKTGASLWASPLMDAPATAPAITYSVGVKQYVAIFAGGEGHDDPTTPTVRGDSVYAFALPGATAPGRC